MPIILPHNLTSPEIRLLQEFRRVNAETLALTVLGAIKHPALAGDEKPVVGLVEKGFLEADTAGENFTLTKKGKDFLAIDAKPEFEETTGAADSAAESAEADAV